MKNLPKRIIRFKAARYLWKIILILSGICAIAYLVGGISWFPIKFGQDFIGNLLWCVVMLVIFEHRIIFNFITGQKTNRQRKFRGL